MSNFSKSARLVKRVQRGDLEAFSKLYDIHFKHVYYRNLKMLREEHHATEVTHEVFAQVWKKIHSLNNPNTFLKWLNVIAHNTCLNHIDKKKRDRHHVVDAHVDEQEEVLADEGVHGHPERSCDRAEQKRLILLLIEELTVAQKEAVLLYYFDGLKTEEIAEITGSNPSAIHKLLSNARKYLRDNFDKICENNGLTAADFEGKLLCKSLDEEARQTASDDAKKSVLAALMVTIKADMAPGLLAQLPLRARLRNALQSAGEQFSTQGAFVAVAVTGLVVAATVGLAVFNHYDDASVADRSAGNTTNSNNISGNTGSSLEATATFAKILTEGQTTSGSDSENSNATDNGSLPAEAAPRGGGAIVLPIVKAISITPEESLVYKGDYQVFVSKVLGDRVSQDIIWSVDSVAGSTIDFLGILHVSPYETADTLHVTATSVQNSAVEGIATVRIEEAPDSSPPPPPPPTRPPGVDILEGNSSDIGKKFVADGQQWRVLTVDENENILILAEDIVGFSKFSLSTYLSYEGSLLQENMGAFYENLSELKNYVQPVELKSESVVHLNSSELEGLSVVSGDTKTVFPLSASEVILHLSNPEDRTALYQDSSCGWWLRSSTKHSFSAAYVDPSGYLRFGGVFSEIGMRPAAWIHK